MSCAVTAAEPIRHVVVGVSRNSGWDGMFRRWTGKNGGAKYGAIRLRSSRIG